MSPPALPKLHAGDLATVRSYCQFEPGVLAAVEGCASVPELLERLAAGAFLIEAARVVAYGLPKREAVWWACMCAAHTAPGELAEADRAAAAAARDWVRRQNDEMRRAAMKHAERAGYKTPEAWAAVAAFFSGDSLSEPGLPKVPPAANLTGQAVAGAVVLASVRGKPERQAARLQRFIESARQIAAGAVGTLPLEEE